MKSCLSNVPRLPATSVTHSDSLKFNCCFLTYIYMLLTQIICVALIFVSQLIPANKFLPEILGDCAYSVTEINSVSCISPCCHYEMSTNHITDRCCFILHFHRSKKIFLFNCLLLRQFVSRWMLRIRQLIGTY